MTLNKYGTRDNGKEITLNKYGTGGKETRNNRLKEYGTRTRANRPTYDRTKCRTKTNSPEINRTKDDGTSYETIRGDNGTGNE